MTSQHAGPHANAKGIHISLQGVPEAQRALCNISNDNMANKWEVALSNRAVELSSVMSSGAMYTARTGETQKMDTSEK
jgi:hypothetical protein